MTLAGYFRGVAAPLAVGAHRMLEISHFIDTRGEFCPVPLLKARHALSELVPGPALEILASYPLAALDLEALCAREGHSLVSLATQSDGLRAIIVKRGDA